MRSVEEQLALITDAAMTPEPVRIAITDALGMMCAEEVQASQPLPGFPQAAIDGYAVRAVDIGESALCAQPHSERQRRQVTQQAKHHHYRPPHQRQKNLSQ